MYKKKKEIQRIKKLRNCIKQKCGDSHFSWRTVWREGACPYPCPYPAIAPLENFLSRTWGIWEFLLAFWFGLSPNDELTRVDEKKWWHAESQWRAEPGVSSTPDYKFIYVLRIVYNSWDTLQKGQNLGVTVILGRTSPGPTSPGPCTMEILGTIWSCHGVTIARIIDDVDWGEISQG